MSAPNTADQMAISKVDFSHLTGEVVNGLNWKRKVAYHMTYNWDKMIIGAVVVAGGAYFAKNSGAKKAIPSVPKM
eukprot:gene24143-30455_t